MNLDCSGVTTEDLAICEFFLIESGDSVVLVTLTFIFLSNIVEIEKDMIRIAASVNLSTEVSVHVVFHSDEWLSNAEIVFVFIAGTVELS